MFCERYCITDLSCGLKNMFSFLFDFFFSFIGYSKISVTSEVLYKLITQESSGVPVKPVLLTVAGLPECGKSKVLNEVLKEKVKVKHDAMAHYTPQKREISYCELSATVHPFGQDSYPTYIETSKSTTYVYAIESALKSQFLWQSKLIYGYHVPICNENFFGDEELNSHFLYIMRELEKSHQRKNVTDWDESVTDNWHKQIPNGVTLINIWDVNASKAVFHFLPSLWGKLGRCHTWLFCNVDRDFEHFHEKPYLSKGQKDDQHLMPYHNRLYYLLQQSLLSKSKAYHKNRVCSVFGFQNQSETDTSNISELISNEAGRMGVNNIVDENVTILNHKSYEILKKKLDEIVYTTQESRETIPLKYIFLRSLFYTLTKIFVSKDVLKSKAKKVKMSEEDVQRFCEIFTSSGSLFDLDPNLPFVIMKPIGFVRKLEKLFYPESKLEDDKLLEYGLLTAERAKEIFGEEYECFLQVLITQNLIVDLSSVSVYSDTCEVPIHDAYYMPSVRSVPPDLKSDPQSLHLLLDIDCSLCHMQVLFAKRYLHANKQCALILEKGLPVNITKFKLGQSDFQLQYLGDVIEFRISDSGTDGLASIIIDMCNKVMQQDGPSIKYNFAVMCLKCHSREDADCLNRPHHILPCDQCIHCNGSHSVMNLFNGILKHVSSVLFDHVIYALVITLL